MIKYDKAEAMRNIFYTIDHKSRWHSGDGSKTIDGLTSIDWHEKGAHQRSLLCAIYHGVEVYCEIHDINTLEDKAQMECDMLWLLGRAIRFNLDDRGCYHTQLVNAMIWFNKSNSHERVMFHVDLAIRLAMDRTRAVRA